MEGMNHMKIKLHDKSGLFISECGRIFKEASYSESGGARNRRYKAVAHKAKKYDVHRLVAETYIPNDEKKPWVLHKDDQSQNNCVDNLYWGSPTENQKDRRNNKGARESVLEMWRAGMTLTAIAKVAAISLSRVSQIVQQEIEEQIEKPHQC